MPHRLLIALVIVLLSALPAMAEEEKPPTPKEVVAGVVDAADALLATLDEKQREQLLFTFDDGDQRLRWSNLPVNMVKRAGLRMGDLNKAQRDAVYRLIRATMSERGYQEFIDNVNGDEELRKNARQGAPPFGRDEFFVSILGKPSSETPWMWQFGGHHLAVNATVAGERITLSPTLTGGQPTSYEIDGRKVRLLGGEVKAAAALMAALDADQKTKAVVSDQRGNLAFGPRAREIKTKAEGIRADQLNEKQQALLKALIAERVGILNHVHAAQAMQRITKSFGKTYFAWFGPTGEDAVGMWRIQGPTVIIEFCPQRLGGDPANHVHAMFREPGNDYGKAFVAQDAEE